MNASDTKPKRSDEELEQELLKIAAIRDEDIDTGDIPELTDEQWGRAVKGRHFRPNKTSVTIRLDADLIDWFKTKAESGGYQTEINKVLRRHMMDAIKKAG